MSNDSKNINFDKVHKAVKQELNCGFQLQQHINTELSDHRSHCGLSHVTCSTSVSFQASLGVFTYELRHEILSQETGDCRL